MCSASSSRGEEKDGGYGCDVEEKDSRDESKCAEEKDDGRGRRSPQAAHPWLAGTMVQRDIDGMWFPARILSMSGGGAGGGGSYDVEYLDDGKTEHGVPSHELRITTEANEDEPRPSQPAPLALPLEGLLGYTTEDAAAPTKTPRAIVHTQNDDTAAATVFVVDGSQSAVPRGGGIRSIRFLRQSTRS
mmetsp:Transcript_2113/g.4574  ORF Transcript_2113/g.4574 Transcript_2113/m.4574 type:complete len:188 (+) Transcript_2113:251-814(+)